MPFTTSSVDALPAFSTLIRTPRWPSCRTMLVCGANPSLTCATSLHVHRRAAGEPDGQVVVGVHRLRAGAQAHVVLELADLGAARRQDRGLRATALSTSWGASPFDCSSRGSRLMLTCRCLPPYGSGTTAPGTVISWVRRKLNDRSFSSCSDSPLPDTPELQHRHARCAEVDDLRRQGPGRHEAQRPLRRAGHLRVRGIEAGTRLQDRSSRSTTPLTVVDSRCSMLSTRVVRAR